MALARSEGSPERFYSMSARIRRERGAWQVWFLDCLARACADARRTLAAVPTKAAFWEAHATDRLLDGMEGKLTSSRWARMAGCSQDTANRDIRDLVDRNILARGPAGGRSTSYALAEGWGA